MDDVARPDRVENESPPSVERRRPVGPMRIDGRRRRRVDRTRPRRGAGVQRLPRGAAVVRAEQPARRRRARSRRWPSGRRRRGRPPRSRRCRASTSCHRRSVLASAPLSPGANAVPATAGARPASNDPLSRPPIRGEVQPRVVGDRPSSRWRRPPRCASPRRSAAAKIGSGRGRDEPRVVPPSSVRTLGRPVAVVMTHASRRAADRAQVRSAGCRCPSASTSRRRPRCRGRASRRRPRSRRSRRGRTDRAHGAGGVADEAPRVRAVGRAVDLAVRGRADADLVGEEASRRSGSPPPPGARVPGSAVLLGEGVAVVVGARRPCRR